MLSVKWSLPLSVALAISTGCATGPKPTDYAGPGPRLGLRGAEAQKEIKKFSLNEDGDRGNFYEVGVEKAAYTVESFNPIVGKVSPEAANSLRKGAHWSEAGLIGVGVSVGGLIAATVSSDANARSDFSNVSILGSIIGLGCYLVAPFMVMAVPAEYNRDLRRQLSPELGMNFSF
jgi:hypothetical protein